VGATGKVFDVQGVTTDSSGDVYVVGTFGNAGSTAHFGTHAITSATSTSIFVAKYFPGLAGPVPIPGSWVWATAVNALNSTRGPLPAQGYGIVIDGLGRVDIVGSGGGMATSSIVVAQLNSSNGAVIWNHSFTGINPSSSGAGLGITAQPLLVAAGSLLDITGTIQGTINFAGPVTSPGPSDLFVGQLTETGAPVWGRALPIPQTASASGRGITYDPAQGVIAAVGTFSTKTSALLVAEYSSGGGFLKEATPLGSSLSSQGTGITADRLGHLYVTGKGFIPPGTNNDAIAAKLNEATLAPLWVRHFSAAGPTRSAEALGVAVDKSGNPYITGAFSGTISFGAGPLASVAGSLDVFAAKLNPITGLATWSSSGGGTGPDVANGIAFDIPSISQVYIVGDDTPTATFGTTALGMKGPTNIFLASLL
jgi:hypothetical protein